MKTKPYKKASEIVAELWDKAAKAIGTTSYCLFEVYLRDNWTSVGAKNFCDGLSKENPDKKFVESVKEGLSSLTAEEIQVLKEKDEKKQESFAGDGDFTDLIYYRLKQMIEVGDEIVSTETKKYCFSNKQYLTKGKKYRITELDDRNELLLGDFIATTITDIKGECDYISNYGIGSVWRKGKEIWNWNLAYLELWMEQNPGHPETEEMVKFCTEQAEKTGMERNE